MKAVAVPLESVKKISDFLSASLLLSDNGAAQKVASGLYGDSAFYKARQPFSILHNCNDWALLALKAGGCDVSIPWLATADSVFEAAGE